MADFQGTRRRGFGRNGGRFTKWAIHSQEIFSPGSRHGFGLSGSISCPVVWSGEAPGISALPGGPKIPGRLPTTFNLTDADAAVHESRDRCMTRLGATRFDIMGRGQPRDPKGLPPVTARTRPCNGRHIALSYAACSCGLHGRGGGGLNQRVFSVHRRVVVAPQLYFP